MLVVAASIGTKKRRKYIRGAIEDVVDQVAPCTWRVAFWPCDTDPCLQIADYCTWAVQRKHERGDPRSHVLIQDKIRTEHDYFQRGSKYYY
jgi:hypothetical protein